MAFETFVQCVKAFPYDEATASQMNFNASSALKRLGSIVDKLTHLATCDLFLSPDQVSLKKQLASSTEPAIVGGLLERQLDCLEPNLSKEGVKVSTKLF